MRALGRGGAHHRPIPGVASSMSSETTIAGKNGDLLRWSADIVAAYVAQHPLPTHAVGDLIRQVHSTLTGLGQPTEEREAERRRPAVPIARSVQEDHIICLEDGRKLKMLKRYLRARYDMSPEEYRRRWGLSPDYPMVAPLYARRRSDFAKQIGLGKGVRRRSK
jgi:predicted transcriptional regulator